MKTCASILSLQSCRIRTAGLLTYTPVVLSDCDKAVDIYTSCVYQIDGKAVDIYISFVYHIHGKAVDIYTSFV